MSKDVSKLSPAELVTLKYDLATDLYRQRAKALESEAASNKEWLPYFVYKAFGSDLIPSLALMLNPYWSLDPNVQKLSNKKVPGLYPPAPVAVNRTRTRTVGFKKKILTRYTVYGTLDGTHLVWTGGGWDFAANPTGYFPTNGTYTYENGWSYPLMEFIKDTTWKSRNPNQGKIPKSLADRRVAKLNEQGDCEMINYRFTSPNASCNWVDYDYSWNDLWDSRLTTTNLGTYSVVFENGSASVDPSTLPSTAESERTFALDAMADNVDQLVASCLPSRRPYNAFYQLSELRDLPQTLRGTLSAWKDVESLMGIKAFQLALKSPKFWTRQNIILYMGALRHCKVYLDPDKSAGQAYLTYKFGWQSMYQAVDQLVHAPQKITKEINYLIRMNGRDATLSTIMHLPAGEWPSHPTITPYIPYQMSADPDKPFSVNSSRRASIRCVVNTGINMPDLDAPILRNLLYADKIGLIPRPSDLWNIIPWTWLVDWFSGVSGYLRLVEEVQLDRSIINWGMATFRSELWASASIGSYVLHNKSFIHNASGSVHDLVVEKSTLIAQGTIEASYKLRVGVQSLAQVKLASGFRLSETQKRILTALVSTRSGPARRSL
jgi:hypothetical protein